ncbi:MAG: hypothetical protein K2Z81_25045, partial [Cyanobacteria bacterium]|nr:hypothetical protein [Cyanobacteriota bacterium]
HQVQLRDYLLRLVELKKGREFLNRVETNHGKTLVELPEDEQLKLKKQYKIELAQDLDATKRELDKEQVLLTEEIKRLGKTEATVTDSELDQIWSKMHTTRLTYELMRDWLQDIQIPKSFETIAEWQLTIPPGCPVAAPTDGHNNHVTAPELLKKLSSSKADMKLHLDRFPTVETMEALNKALIWCSGIERQKHDILIKRDLEVVIPNMMQHDSGYKQSGYPKEWLNQTGLSDEARRDSLLYLIAVCDTVREYADSMHLSSKLIRGLLKKGELTFPPCVERIADASGREHLRFNWPANSSLSNPETIKWLAECKKWVETQGKLFDTEMSRLASSKDITSCLMYGDVPMKGFAILDENGKLKEVRDAPGPNRHNFNLLRATYDIERVGNQFKVTTKWTAANSKVWNWLDIAAKHVGEPRIRTEFLKPGAMVRIIHHGKDRVVPVEEAAGMKREQQVFYWGEKAVVGLTDLSLFAFGFGAAGLALYAGKAGLKAAALGAFRGTLGGSGILLDNAQMATDAWGQRVRQLRSALIIADVSHGLYGSFKSAAPPAYLTAAKINLANSEWRFTKLIRTPLIGLNELPENSKVVKGLMGANETAFLAIMGREFYLKFGHGTEENPEIPNREEDKQLAYDSRLQKQVSRFLQGSEPAHRPFAIATAMRNILQTETDEPTRVKAVQQLTLVMQGLIEFERNDLHKMNSDQKLDYMIASSGNSAADLRLFLNNLAADKSQPDNLRLMAAKCLSVVSAPSGSWLHRQTSSLTGFDSKSHGAAVICDLDQLVSNYSQSPQRFAQLQLADLRSKLSESHQPVDRIASIDALINLGELGGYSTPKERSKLLMDTINLTTSKLLSGKATTREDCLVAAEALGLLRAEEFATLTVDDRKRLIQVLSLPETPGVEAIKVQLLQKAALFPRGDAELESEILGLIAPPQSLSGKSTRSQNTLVRTEAAKALANINSTSEQTIVYLKCIAQSPDNGGLPLEPSAAVRLAALNALAKLDNSIFRRVADANLRTETEPAIRQMLESYRLARPFSVRIDSDRYRIAAQTTLLDRIVESNWKQEGAERLASISQGYKDVPETVKVIVKQPYLVPRAGGR